MNLSSAAAQLVDRVLAERGVERSDELGGEHFELLSPHRGLTDDREHAVPLGGRTRRGGDRGARRGPPHRLHARKHRQRRKCARELIERGRPGEPYVRSSRPPRRGASSSRWGPYPENPRSRSPSSRCASSLTNSLSSAAVLRGRYASASAPLQPSCEARLLNGCARSSAA